MDEHGHEWVRTQPMESRWCARCGLSEPRWQGFRCGGHVALERRLIESGAADAFRQVGDFDPD